MVGVGNVFQVGADVAEPLTTGPDATWGGNGCGWYRTCQGHEIGTNIAEASKKGPICVGLF